MGLLKRAFIVFRASQYEFRAFDTAYPPPKNAPSSTPLAAG